MSDFLSWDHDIDLDLLLGDYTEYDIDQRSSDGGECSQPMMKKTPESQTLYQCPDCNKTLKTIAGFLDHTQKQHGKKFKSK